MNSQIQVLTGAERIEHYGTILELSIKAVVATGDSEAATRYRRVQPELRKTLSGLRAELKLAPNRAAALQVDRADLALIALEYEALELVGRGNFRDARKLIHSSRYAHLVSIYYAGIAGIEQRASEHIAATEKRLDRLPGGDPWTQPGLICCTLGWLGDSGPARPPMGSAVGGRTGDR